jgi:hypothetical protein
VRLWTDCSTDGGDIEQHVKAGMFDHDGSLHHTRNPPSPTRSAETWDTTGRITGREAALRALGLFRSVTAPSRVHRATLLNHSELLGRFNNTDRRPGWR